MSGSNGGGSNGGGNGTPPTPCDSLTLTTQISSPRADVVNRISVSDILDVGIERQGQQTVVVVRLGNEVAGGIASPQVPQLRDCIESGHQYSAEVLSKNEGQVRIRVRARVG